MRWATYLLLFFSCLAIPGWQAVQAQSAIHRCIGSDGGVIFTDRPCADMHASERAIAAPATAVKTTTTPVSGVKIFARSCAHSPDDLLFGVRLALEAHDVNRLAEFYHWTGMSTAAAYQLLDRLGSFSRRPLMDVQLVSSVDAKNGQDAGADQSPNSAEQSLAMVAAPETSEPSPSLGLLRVAQATNEDDLTVQTTDFRIVSNAGCWWIHF